MIQSVQIQRHKTDYFQKIQTRDIPLVKPDLTALKASKKEALDGLIQPFSDWSASATSNYSYMDMPYRASKDGEEMHYELAFYREAPFSNRNYHDQIDEQ